MPEMRCDDCRALLNGYVDGELTETELTQVRDHLDTCGLCAAERDMLTEVSSRVRRVLGRPQAPDVLKARIRAAIGEADSAAAVTTRRPPSTWTLIAAGVLIAVISAGSGFYFANRPADTRPVVSSEVLSSHLRSLVPGHLTDVASTDLHNVKPWFNGRAGFSPAVPRLDSLGFPLVGGRLDYVGDRQVTAVVYSRRQHFINVFAWPAPAEAPASPSVSSDHGYHLVRWVESGVEYWAASDVSVGDLEIFVESFRREAAK